jgi:hypothetical protein
MLRGTEEETENQAWWFMPIILALGNLPKTGRFQVQHQRGLHTITKQKQKPNNNKKDSTEVLICDSKEGLLPFFSSQPFDLEPHPPSRDGEVIELSIKFPNVTQPCPT